MSNQLEFEISARNQFLEDLKKTTTALEKLQQVSRDTSKQQEESNKKIANSFLEREKNVAKETLAWAKQSEIVDSMATTINRINAEKNIGTDQVKQTVSDLKAQETELAKVYAELEKIGARGEKLIQDIANAAQAGNGDEVNRLVEEFTAGLDPELAKTFTDEFKKGFDEATVAISNPVKELKELKRQINSGELEGEALAVATKRAAELKDQIGDTNDRIKALSSDTFAVDAVISGVEQLAGAFTLAQGAVGLFADDNEELEKALLKVNSAMALLQGIQSVQKALLDESASKTAILIQLEKLRAFVTDQTTGKLKAANVAMLATVGGAVIAGLVLLVANWDKLKAAISGVSEEQKLQTEINQKASDAAAEEVALLETRLRTINKMAPGDKERTKQIKDLQEEYPRYLGNIDAEKVSTEELTKAVNKLKDAYVLEAQIKAAQDKLTENAKKRLEVELKSIEDLLDATDLAAVGAAQITGDAIDGQNKALELARANKNKALKELEQADEAVFKILDKSKAKLAENGGSTGKTDEELAAEEEARQKLLEARRKRLEDQKKAQEEEKRLSEQRLKSRAELAKEFEKLLDEAEKREIEALSGEDKILAQLAYNDQLITAQEQVYQELINSTGAYGAERTQMEAQLEEQIKNLRANAVQEANNQISALRAEEAAKAASQNEQSLNREEQILLAEAETRLNVQRSTFATEEEFEKAKQQSLLAIQLQFAQQRLELLQGTLTSEQEVEKAQLELRISEIKNAIEDAKKEAEKKTGIDGFLTNAFGLNEEQVGKVKDALNQIAQQAAALISQGIQESIAANERLIDSIDSRIEKQQELIETEQELAEQGKANSVATEKKKLDDLQKERQRALQEQEKLRRRQALLDTATQASGLITSSVNIFKALSPLGPIGVAGAIAAIGVMFAAFASARIKAIQAANQTTQLRKGASGSATGFVTGRSHEQGGERFLDHIEVESGEAWAVINRSASRKYGKYFHEMVEAMNRGEDPRSAPSIRPDIYRQYNVEAAKIIHEERMLDFSLMVSSQKATIQKISENTKEISEIKRILADQPKTWTEGDTTVVQKGARIYKKTKRKSD